MYNCDIDEEITVNNELQQYQTWINGLKAGDKFCYRGFGSEFSIMKVSRVTSTMIISNVRDGYDRRFSKKNGIMIGSHYSKRITEITPEIKKDYDLQIIKEKIKRLDPKDVSQEFVDGIAQLLKNLR